MVHRGPEAKTLDGQSIKQYESIKLNQYHLGPYDTMKPSRVRKQSSGENLEAPRPPLGPKPNLEKKRDSFEGHEEAVRTIVEAVQESRKQQHQQQSKKASNNASSSAD